MYLENPDICIAIVVLSVIISTTFSNLLSKIHVEHTLRKINTKQTTTVQMNLGDRIDITNNFMSVIDNIIDIEVKNLLSTRAILRAKYDVRNIDKDINNVAHNVYNSIKSDIFTEECLLIKAEYILSYIGTETTERLMLGVKELNNNIITTNDSM